MTSYRQPHHYNNKTVKPHWLQPLLNPNHTLLSLTI